MADAAEGVKPVEDGAKRMSPEPAIKTEEEQPRPSPTLANRPSSVASTHSNTSSGAPRTTTTSRRGRTRSRSPPKMTNHSGSSGSITEQPFHPAETFDQGGRITPKSPRNPSSAAAAAAAAAKALSTGGRNSSPWGYENGGEGTQRSDRRGDHRYHQGYENTFAGSTGWPGEEEAARRSGYGRDQMNDRYSRRAHYPPHDHPSASQADPYSGRGRAHYDQYDAPYERGYDERYRDSRERGSYDREHSRGRSKSSPPIPHGGPPGQYGDRHHRYDSHGEPYYGGPAGMAPMENSTNSREQSHGYSDPFSAVGGSVPRESAPATVKRAGGTSRVIGTPTPIHLPRAADAPRQHSSHGPTAGTPASVFRGRPDDGGQGRRSVDDSPQKILLSLRTPTTSFDERDSSVKHKGDASSRKNSSSQVAPPLSPEEPPQIHHAHNQHQMDHNLFFEVSLMQLVIHLCISLSVQPTFTYTLSASCCSPKELALVTMFLAS